MSWTVIELIIDGAQLLHSTEIAGTKEVAPGVMIDLDAAGQLVGLELSSLRRCQAGLFVVTVLFQGAAG